ncbi:MAG: hypothetical protein AAF456_08245 [Planctomycetota bacterium]
MPGWYEETKQLVADEKLVLIGVTQEQHAERCRLFARWKEFDFPIVQDKATILGLAVVPVAVLIDEHGLVQSTRVRPAQIESLVNEPHPAPPEAAPAASMSLADLEAFRAVATDDVYAQVASGDAELLWGDEEARSHRAIECYNRAAELLGDEEDSDTLAALIDFRLGVAWRDKFDNSPDATPEDFSRASSYWLSAHNSNPNQYIWRRRIEQYGPRLMKPYPFYDWIDTANEELVARGEEPVELKIDLSGAEIAFPAREQEVADRNDSHPDPEMKVTLDPGAMITSHSTLVPHAVAPGKSVRVHLDFVPVEGHKWNNESTPLQVWIDEPQSGTTSMRLLEVAGADEATSSERRRVEFEYYAAEGSTGEVTLSGVAFYNACSDEDGQCLFRRQDFVVTINVVE